MSGKSDGREVKDFIYKHRLVGKWGVAQINKLLPRFVSRRITALAEKVSYYVVPEYQRDTLPPIFHYWSGRYIYPKLASVGLRSPEELYYKSVIDYAQKIKPDGRIDIISFGAGGSELELGLVARLRSDGVDAHIECVDFNPSLKKQAMARADKLEVVDAFKFTVKDCNRIIASSLYDVIIVNQFFHHVDNIEGFCRALRMQLRLSGLLLTCDVIGRNGHALWPTVDSYVQSAWKMLEDDKRYDKYFGSVKDNYVSVDHSMYSNEGIRAQDIVASLLREFDFELFISYGGSIMPFVERRIGFNFDSDDSADRDFIDRVARGDEKSISSKEYPASNMVAVLRHVGKASKRQYIPISPHDHVNLTRNEMKISGE